MMGRVEAFAFGLMRVFVALVFLAGISWGVAVTAAQVMGVPQSRVMGVMAIVGLMVGLAMLNSAGKKRPPVGPSTPDSLLDLPPSRGAQSSSGRWRELREIERCRQEGLISERQAQIERARILGPEAPEPR
jgi:hypothetical protein